MTTIYEYTYKCLTENAIITDDLRYEDESAPTKCKNDTTHTIDMNSRRVTNIIKENKIIVQEENIPTGGHFRAISKSIDLIGTEQNNIKNTDFSFKYNISALAIEFVSDSNNQGDMIEMVIGPDSGIGYITSDVSINDTVINVDNDVLTYVQIGYKVKLFDGTNIEDLGLVLSIDKDNKTITVENPSTQTFSATTPSTGVLLNAYVIEDYTIGKPGRWVIGESKIGGSFIKANTTIRFIYHNNTGGAKNFTAQLEYLF